MLLSLLLGWMGPWQIVLIVVVILLLFGGRKIPELMRGLGRGMKEFKDATKDEGGNNSGSSDSSKDSK
jgi:sec-independent protein translocase protein TatA